MSPIAHRAAIAAACLAAATALAAEPDAAGCKDHALVTRMPGYHIYSCRQAPFDSWKVTDAKGREHVVEGRLTSVQYYLDEGRPEPSRVQLLRNYGNALKPLGGEVVGQVDDGAETWMRVANQGREMWVHLSAYGTAQYLLEVLETGTMAQEVTADAAAFSKDILANGHVAVYGIHFDTGKADVKAESDATLKEVARLLAASPKLQLLVVGHTDNVGQPDANLRLSRARADAVVKALASRFGVAAARLSAQGAGPIAPVASNRTEEGRARNRRVELVER